MRKKDDTETLVEKNNGPTSDIKYDLMDTNCLTILHDNQEFVNCFANAIDYKSNLLEFIQDNDFYLNIPEVETEEDPLNIEVAKEQQIQDEDLQKWVKKYPDQCFQTDIGDVQNILYYCKQGKDK